MANSRAKNEISDFFEKHIKPLEAEIICLKNGFQTTVGINNKKLLIMDANKIKNVLVVVAHTDDETIGMGGTIARHVSNGDKVYCIAMTDGVSARKESNSTKIEKRNDASDKSAFNLGFEWLNKFSFPDNQLDTVPILDIIQAIEAATISIQPDIIYTHSACDLNIDHVIVSRAVLTAFRPKISTKPYEIRLFEVSSATDFGFRDITGQFTPNLFIDIKNFWYKKEKALLCYKDEIRPYPNSRSMKAIKNLAKIRGNQIGLEMAEAFTLIRKVENN